MLYTRTNEEPIFEVIYLRNMQSLGYDITSESVTEELKRHNEWKEINKLSATPTILVNGYLLPEHYQIEDMVEFVDSKFNN